MSWGPDRWRVYGLALQEAVRAGSRAVRIRWPAFAVRAPERLLLAPQDLRTADPTVAEHIYAGHYVFAAKGVEAGGGSPFAIRPPSRAWAQGLYGFGWLRHLRAADTALARSNARALVDDFLTRGPARWRSARETRVVARRLISFLAQSPLLLDGADHAFYRRFLRSLAQAARELEADLRAGGQPLPRLDAAIALAYAGLCCEGWDPLLRRASRLLARELDRQILPDGGHVSRSPRASFDLLLDLLPLRQTYASRGVEPPEALLRAIDRMLPLLRLFRHGDGAMARFNGMGVSEVDHLATLLVYAQATGEPIRHAPHAGYERLEAGGTLVIAEVGPAPPVHASPEAHAGCLSFELSSGLYHIVVNCGAPQGDDLRQAARETAAHSTAEVGDLSTCRFLFPRGPRRLSIGRWLRRRIGPVVLHGPETVPAKVDRQPAGATLVASHDGYRRLGVAHERRWRLSGNGERLEGEDAVTGAARREPVRIRFHLHPGVRASRVQGGHAVLLMLPNGEAWQFESSLPEAALEDSLFLAGAEGVRRTEQIVLTTAVGAEPVRWSFERLTRAKA